MQIVGLNCGVCGKRIIAESSARSCPPCSIADHSACLGVTESCPECGIPFKVSLQEEQKRREEENRRDLALQISLSISIVLSTIATISFLQKIPGLFNKILASSIPGSLIFVEAFILYVMVASPKVKWFLESQRYVK